LFRLNSVGCGSRIFASSQPTMPESSTELSTSFAPASKGSCTWLGSLVSLVFPKRPCGYPRRHSHSAVDAVVKLPYRELGDPGSSQAEDISVPGSPRRLEGKQPSR